MAVRDMNIVVDKLADLLGINEIPLLQYKNNAVHYQIALLNLGEFELELIEPLTKAGMAHEHLRDFGPGVYHIAIEVEDLPEALNLYKKRGFESQEIREGVHGERICFLKEPILPGIYLELIESK
ncbi:MAG: VOC family protein [Syntrophaceae bacterium]|nr:VOC family protein [Syntrophaceae bacterium]